jgi:hypothetical protein
MVERIHNVTERGSYPQKRRKLDEEHDGNENKARFSGSGNAGVLGEYVREKREESGHEAMSNGAMPSVDLTGGKSFFYLQSQYPSQQKL